MFWLVSPFISYVTITYAKNFELSANLFNPLIVVEFMKKAFKSSVFVALKYILVNLIAGFATSLITGICLVAIFVLAFFSAASTPEGASMYTSPIFVVSFVILSTIMTLIQTYVNSIVGYSMLGNLIEVYKSEIEQIEM